MSHNSEVDIDYESLPIGAGQYLVFILLLSFRISSWWVLLVLEGGGCPRVWSWREAESSRNEVILLRQADCWHPALNLDLQFWIWIWIWIWIFTTTPTSTIITYLQSLQARTRGKSTSTTHSDPPCNLAQAPMTVSSSLLFIRLHART
jgi:hypothetical protein